MKTIVSVFFCCTFFLKLPAQPLNNDSLINIIISPSTEDQRIDALLLLFDQYESTYQNDSTMYYALEMQKLGQKHQIHSIEILGYAEMGYIFYRLGNKPMALEITLKALKMAEALGNIRVMLSIYNPLALIHEGTDKEIEYFKKALQLPPDKNTYKERFWILNNLSRAFVARKQYDSALLYAQQANQLILTKDYNYGLRNSLLTYGRIYSGLDQDELAFTYLKLALAEAVKNGANSAIRNVYLALGSCYEGRGMADSGFYYTKMGLRLAMNEAANTRIAPSHAVFKYYLDREQNDSALKYLMIYTEAKDSTDNIERMQKLKSLEFEEDLRQIELAAQAKSDKDERKHNLQYAAIAVALITFVILFLLLSRSIIVKNKFIEFFGVLGLLAVFEFINLYLHPHLDKLTNHSPVLMLLILIGIGALLVPLHHRLEKWITKIMVEKNKKIRLDAAKKTIAALEREQTT